MGIGVVTKNHLQPPSTMFLQQIILKITISRFFIRFNFLMSFTCHSHVICMRLYFTYIYAYPIRMSVVCNGMSSVCHSYVLVCHSYVLVCHPYVNSMYWYVINMSIVCTRMSSVCHSSVVLPWTFQFGYFVLRSFVWYSKIIFECFVSNILLLFKTWTY